MGRHPGHAVAVILLFSCIVTTLGQTCEGRCGERSELCSCHPTCGSLSTCCGDYKVFCVEAHPYSGSSFGGTDLTILHATFNLTSQIVCRFNEAVNTVGYVDAHGRAHCISPLLYQTGWVPLGISTDNGTSFTTTGAWLSVHTGKLDAALKAVLENATQWQYYGTPGVGGPLKLEWNSTLVAAERVNIELWGYRETGETYSDAWQGEWRYLYSLKKDLPNAGTLSFVPQPAQHGFSSWELGSVRISPSSNPEGTPNVHALWTEDHALAWHLDNEFRQNSAAWAMEKCLKWDALEGRLPNFLEEIIDCPCTLAQARADTGRYHTDYGCDIEKGSVCTYHQGSVHCVRAIHGSPKYGAGQQCCYDSSGAQVLTADSIGGSTPDRAHDWGSPPYRRPPRVPGQSHWVYDVLSFYYCCLWSDNCHYYFKHRPSSTCITYRSPRSGVVFGDPHFITFDGVTYSFNGKGEYTLVVSETKRLLVQGRTTPVSLPDGTAVNATTMSAVAMREGSSDVIEVRLGGGGARLEVLQNQRVLSFREQSWVDLDGVFVFSPSAHNVTVMFPSGAGVELRLRQATMTTTVLLPEDFLGATLGMLGKMNGDPSDDLATPNGQIVSVHSTPEELFAFGGQWAISNKSSLFTYDSGYLLETYFHAPRHDPSFIPVFSPPDDEHDPLKDQAAKICAGEGEAYCRYDVLVGRSPNLGNATKMSYLSHLALVEDLKPVVSCGRLTAPANGKKVGTRYLLGATVSLFCDEGYELRGPAQRTCQGNGLWSGDPTTCVLPDNIVGIVVGCVVGGFVLILIVTTVILKSRRKSNTDSESPEDMNEAF